MTLKLYVWDPAFEGAYSAGIAFALAESAEQARALILALDDGEPEVIRKICRAELEKEPDVYECAVGFRVLGTP